MDHNKPGNSSASVEGYLDVRVHGPASERLLHPRYRNVGKDKRDYLRGFGYQGRAARRLRPLQRQRARSARTQEGVQRAGPWNLGMTAFGEILPYHDNHMRLDRDEEGQVRSAAARGQRRRARQRAQDGKDMRNDAAEMLEAAGYKNVA
jgi:hypothetical protein